jgi:hypothetical protein
MIATDSGYFVSAEIELTDAEAEHAHLFYGVARVIGEVVAGEV